MAIGRESLYALCHDTFVCTFNSLSWLSDSAVMAALGDVVFVSASKVLIKLKATASQDQLLDALAAFDSRSSGSVRQLFDNHARQVFVFWSQRGSHAETSKHRARTNHNAAPQTRVISLAKHLGDETRSNNAKRRKLNLEAALPETLTPFDAPFGDNLFCPQSGPALLRDSNGCLQRFCLEGRHTQTGVAHSSGGGRGVYNRSDGDVPMCLLPRLGVHLN